MEENKDQDKDGSSDGTGELLEEEYNIKRHFSRDN